MILVALVDGKNLLRKPSWQNYEVWVILQVEPNLVDEFLFVLPWWHISCNNEIDDACILGLMYVTFGSMLSHKKLLIHNAFVLVICIWDKWFTIEFSTPILSFISKSNSWSKRIKVVRQGCATFLGSKYYKFLVLRMYLLFFYDESPNTFQILKRHSFQHKS